MHIEILKDVAPFLFLGHAPHLEGKRAIDDGETRRGGSTVLKGRAVGSMKGRTE
jgi:hypothetical protein